MSQEQATIDSQTLVALVTKAVGRVNTSGAHWLSQKLAESAPSELIGAFTLVSRKIGKLPLQLDFPALPTPKGGWDASLCARMTLLVRFADSHSRDEQRRAVSELFYKGDSAEQCAVLRALSLLADPGAHSLVATDGVRSHVQPVFEAIACENPYPQKHLDEAAFNQLVMKALFTGVEVARIVGLGERLNSELRRMAIDFKAEREAAGRPVPADLAFVITPANPGHDSDSSS